MEFVSLPIADQVQPFYKTAVWGTEDYKTRLKKVPRTVSFNCPEIFIFILLCLIHFRFLRLFIYVFNIGQVSVQVLFITQEKFKKFYSACLTFKCRGPTVSLLACKYLFTLVKAAYIKSILKCCQGKRVFQPGFSQTQKKCSERNRQYRF